MNAPSHKPAAATVPASDTEGTPESSTSTSPARDVTFWYAHDQPEKPFDQGVLICECAACRLAVRAAAQANPKFRLVVRGGTGRRVVTLADAADAVTAPEGLAALLQPGDWLRDLCAAAHNPEATTERRTTVALRAALARLDSGAPAVAPAGQAIEPPGASSSRQRTDWGSDVNQQGAPLSLPSREVSTTSGVLYASTNDAETVQFSTVDPNGQRPESPLWINGVEHSFQVGLRRGEVPAGREVCWRLDDTWYYSAQEAMHSLHRPAGGPFTPAAWIRVRHDLLPELAEWVHSEQGQALLDEGRATGHDACKDLAGAAVVALRIALGTARSVLRALTAGEPIRPGDEQFLRDVIPQVDRWMETAGRAPAPKSPLKFVPLTNPPEALGL